MAPTRARLGHGAVARQAWPAAAPAAQGGAKLSGNVAALGFVSLCMGMSSAMIYGLLPGFLVRVLGVGVLSIGAIEGIAEATTSLVKIFSGRLSDGLGRRKFLVVAGYGLSAVTKLLFPLAESAAAILLARSLDRVGKGMRDAPRDALLADVTPSEIRGSGFGLRAALYTVGAVAGPLAAMALMLASGDNFRLVFWLAAIPGFLSVLVLLGAVKDAPFAPEIALRLTIRRSDLHRLSPTFWWAVSVAALLSLARCSQAFLLLKAAAVGVDPALVPVILVLMNFVFSLSAYPCGVLADRIDRRRQLAAGLGVLIAADLTLVAAPNFWLTALGAGLWGLQMGLIQGLLSALVADAAPSELRGTGFAILDVAVGGATLLSGVSAGALWLLGGAAATFGAAAAFAFAAGLALLLRPAPDGLAKDLPEPRRRSSPSR
jgi:MFS family permease